MQVNTIIILIILLAGNLHGQFDWNNFATENIIGEIIEDQDFIWIGSQGALIRLDKISYEKKIFQADNSPLRGLGIADIEIDADGTKWFGSENAGLFRVESGNWSSFRDIGGSELLIKPENIRIYDNGVWFISRINDNCNGCRTLINYENGIFTNHTSSIPGKITRFELAQSGEIWVMAENILYRYDGQQITQIFDTNGGTPELQNVALNNMATDTQNNLFLSFSKQVDGEKQYGILIYDHNNWSLLTTSNPTRKLIRGGDGNIYIDFYITGQTEYGKIANNKLILYDSTLVKDIPYWNTPPILKYVDSNDSWWFHSYTGTTNPKIYSVTNQNLKAHDTSIDGLSSNYNSCIIQDCEENILIGSHNTIDIFDGSKWTEYFYQLNTQSINDLVIHPQTCEKWFTSSSNGEGGLFKYDGNALTKYEVGDWGALCLDITNDGKTLVGTSLNGLGILDGGNWTWYDKSNSPLADPDDQITLIRDVLATNDNSIWVVPHQKGIMRLKNEEWTIFNNINSSLEEKHYFIYEDSDNNIWTVGKSVLFKFQNEEWITYDLPFVDIEISSIVEDDQKNFWIGTYSHGVFYWNGMDYLNYTIDNSNISSNFVTKVFVDNQNDLWCIHNTGVSKLTARNLDFNTGIQGTVFFDLDQDGKYDESSELIIPFEKVQLKSEGQLAITDRYGVYNIFPNLPGNYSIEHILNEPYTNTTPSILEIQYDNDKIENVDFGIYSEDIPSGISIDLTTSPAICEFETNAWVTVTNKGLNKVSGTINLNFNGHATYLNSFPLATQIQSDQVEWIFEGLEFKESKIFKLTLLSPDLPAINPTLDYRALVTTNDTLITKEIKESLDCYALSNDKLCIPGNELEDTNFFVWDPINYSIRFQNTTGQTAINITIIDTLDSQLDLDSYQFISSSHDVKQHISSSGIMTFTFNNINLPSSVEDFAASQGFIKFSISAKPELEEPILIRNKAYIYYDFSEAIETNTTEIELVGTVSIDDEEFAPSQLNIAPNPTSHFIHILDDLVEPLYFELFNNTGEKLKSGELGNNSNIELSGYPAGLYVLKSRYKNQVFINRIIKF